MPVTKVHVIFKTHLDVGFTDLANKVIERYESVFIPQAIRLAEACREPNGRQRFVWTTGSYLIDHYLRHATSANRAVMEQAIRNGWVTWHALPFSMHSELMSPDLFQYGLTLSKRLDQEFGRHTIAAKMTDVPGHSRAIVPMLAKAGIRYLHIGVNPASTRPRVPRLFRWQTPDGSEIVVHYADSYGDESPTDGFEETLVFSHSGDNQMPPDRRRIIEIYADLAKRFPHADIQASTLDAYAATAWAHREQLPVVTEEIGDTWIHGTGSDPKKLAHFRELLRLRTRWLSASPDCAPELDLFSDHLLMIPEHTWGVDHKKYLGDYRNYAKSLFHVARERDVVDRDKEHPRYRYVQAFAPTDADTKKTLHSQHRYRFLEASWDEQRQYLVDAVEALPADKRLEAKTACANLVPEHTKRDGFMPLTLGEDYSLGTFIVNLGSDGAIHSLVSQCGGNRQWVTPEHPIGLFSYETFGPENYQRWFNDYVKHLPETYEWADADFGKPGLELVIPAARHQLMVPQRAQAWLKRESAEDRVVLCLTMPSSASDMFGCPVDVELEFQFYHQTPQISATLQWFRKDAVRMPEALWFSVAIAVENPQAWRIGKLGSWIDPFDVVLGGNRAMHASDGHIRYCAADARIDLSSMDTGLVSIGDRNLLNFRQDLPNLLRGFHINLFNNVWGTNFVAWYEENAKFRFGLRLEDTLA